MSATLSPHDPLVAPATLALGELKTAVEAPTFRDVVGLSTASPSIHNGTHRRLRGRAPAEARTMSKTQPPVNTVLTLAEVHAFLGEAAVRRRIRQGVWQSPLPGIVVDPARTTHERPASRGCACVGGATSGADRGNRRSDRRPQGVRGRARPRARPRTAAPWRSRDFVVVHRTHLLDSLHVHPTRRPRRARVERAIIDIATGARSWQDAIAVTAASVQQGLTRVSDLEQVLARLSARRVGDASCCRCSSISRAARTRCPSWSLSALIRVAGFPSPDVKPSRMDGQARRYLDLFWDAFPLCIEIDGRLHIGVATWWADMVRDAEIPSPAPQCHQMPGVRDPDELRTASSTACVGRWSAAGGQLRR